MGIIIDILIGILVLVCIFLVLIILMQKSKQEAGLGAAFGGAATEQLFGAGTTSVLTKATIWGTAIFFIITLILAIYYSHEHHKSITSRVLGAISTNEVPSIMAPVATNAIAQKTAVTNGAVAAGDTNALPALTATNAPATK
jgi:preprotein translocase subunit SecG